MLSNKRSPVVIARPTPSEPKFPLPKYLQSRGNWRALGLESDPRSTAIAASALSLLESHSRKSVGRFSELLGVIRMSVRKDEMRTLFSKFEGDNQAMIRSVAALSDPNLDAILREDFGISSAGEVQRGNLLDIGYRLLAAELQTVVQDAVARAAGREYDSTTTESLLASYGFVNRAIARDPSPQALVD